MIEREKSPISDAMGCRGAMTVASVGVDGGDSVCEGTVAVVPAFEPSGGLVMLVRQLVDLGFRVIVVDDGSGPAYDGIFAGLPCDTVLLRHVDNLGKGAALKTAFAYLRGHMVECERIVTMDADGQHLPVDACRVAQKSKEDPGALVLGSRKLEKDAPLPSRLGNYLSRHAFRAISGVSVEDTQTGMRAFGRDLIGSMIEVGGNRYDYEMNVLLRCAKKGIPIVEVPIRTIYLDAANSCSHYDHLRDSLRILEGILRYVSSSLASFISDYLLFLLFTLLLSSTPGFLALGNVMARFGSAGLNYTLNRTMVFHDGYPVSHTLPRYIALAIGILIANTALLSLLVDVVGMAAPIAKVVTELSLLVVSYSVQSLLIFRGHGAGDKNGATAKAGRAV